MSRNKSKWYILPYGDSPLDNKPVGKNVYLNMINQAQKYIYIDTPYLIINDEIKNALCLAVRRGVDVRIITPGIPDKKMVFKVTRSYYEPLVNGGVRFTSILLGLFMLRTLFVMIKLLLLEQLIWIIAVFICTLNVESICMMFQQLKILKRTS